MACHLPHHSLLRNTMHRVIYITAAIDALAERVLDAAAPRLDVTVVSGGKVPDSLEGFDAVLVGDGRLNSPLPAPGRNGPKLVQLTRGHHLDIDAVALTAAGVTVAGASPVLAPHVARHALALALAVRPGNGLPGLSGLSGLSGLLTREKVESIFRDTEPSMAGVTVGIVGFGRIGTAMADLCALLGATVIYADVRTAARGAAAASGARRSTLDLLLARSDIVSLHVQWGPTSDPLISERELRLLGPESVLVNTADARLVDNRTLAELLRSGRVGGAGLDIEEPSLTLFADAPNTALTPYVAARSAEADEAVAGFAVDNIGAALSGMSQAGGAPAGVIEIVDFPRAGDPAFWSSKMSPRVG